MNMPQATSTSPHDPSSPAVVRLVDTAGRDGPATASEVAGHLQTSGFFWLDLEDPGDDEVAEFSQSLQLPPGTVVSLVHASARSSFAPAADSVQAVLPAAVDTKPTAWLEANYVTVVLTERCRPRVRDHPSREDVPPATGPDHARSSRMSSNEQTPSGNGGRRHRSVTTRPPG